MYKLKWHMDGSIAHFKAQLAAKNYHQQPGLDFVETFNPSIKPATGFRQIPQWFLYLLWYLGTWGSNPTSTPSPIYLAKKEKRKKLSNLLLFALSYPLLSNFNGLFVNWILRTPFCMII